LRALQRLSCVEHEDRLTLPRVPLCIRARAMPSEQFPLKSFHPSRRRFRASSGWGPLTLMLRTRS